MSANPHSESDSIAADTIAAIATPAGAGGIGVVRVSGPGAAAVLKAVFCPANGAKAAQSHVMRYGRVKGEHGETLDEALACFMKKPRSYTREDVAEIHCHGGPAALRAVLGAVLARGARLAEPGEFTKRAFLNGRLDLAQAEAVMDVIRSETEAARRAAVAQLGGGLSRACKAMTEEILAMLASIEASIDYPEHEHEETNLRDAAAGCHGLISRLDALIAGAGQGAALQNGVETAILGRPNVGKSSLLNALAGADRAIVTDIPGTTRDALRELVEVGGVPLRLTDTAGIRETADIIEQMGVERSRRAAQSAALALVVLDGAEPLSPQDVDILRLAADIPRIVIVNKADLPQRLNQAELRAAAGACPVLSVSLKDGRGLGGLREEIERLFHIGDITAGHDALVYTMRHVSALKRCRESLLAALETAENGLGEDFVAIDLRAAYYAVGEVTGETLDEDVIDRIFSAFCLGK